MSVTTVPHPEFQPPRALGHLVPLMAAALVLAVVGFITWFWLAQGYSPLTLLLLYVPAAFFCVDMILLSRRLRAKSKDIY